MLRTLFSQSFLKLTLIFLKDLTIVKQILYLFALISLAVSPIKNDLVKKKFRLSVLRVIYVN